MLLTYDLDGGLWMLAPGSRFAPAKPQLSGVVRPANYADGTNEVVLRRIF